VICVNYELEFLDGSKSVFLMEPIPLKKCMNQLQSLSYSPIIGNNPTPKANQPKTQTKLTDLFQPKVSPPSTETPNRRKRLFDEANLTPEEPDNKAKMAKLTNDDIERMKEVFDGSSKAMEERLEAGMVRANKGLEERLGSSNRDMEARIGESLARETKLLGEKFDTQLTEIRNRQDVETVARQQLESTVVALQEQVTVLSSRQAADPDELARKLLPEVSEAFGDKISAHHSQVKAYNNQMNSAYFQSLVMELRKHEKDMMIYGFKPDNDNELVKEIRDKVFKGHGT
jgi:hypothetical protein